MKKYVPRIITYLSMPITILAFLVYFDFNLREFFSLRILFGFFGGWLGYVIVSLSMFQFRTPEFKTSAKFAIKKNSSIPMLLAFSFAGCLATTFMDNTFIAQMYAQSAIMTTYFLVETYLLYYEINSEEVSNRKSST